MILNYQDWQINITTWTYNPMYRMHVFCMLLKWGSEWTWWWQCSGDYDLFPSFCSTMCDSAFLWLRPALLMAASWTPASISSRDDHLFTVKRDAFDIDHVDSKRNASRFIWRNLTWNILSETRKLISVVYSFGLYLSMVLKCGSDNKSIPAYTPVCLRPCVLSPTSNLCLIRGQVGQTSKIIT